MKNIIIIIVYTITSLSTQGENLTSPEMVNTTDTIRAVIPYNDSKLLQDSILSQPNVKVLSTDTLFVK